MAVYDFPDIIPDSENWGLEANVKTFESQLNMSTQTGELPGSRWTATLTFTNRFGRDARALRGFLVRLGGKSGRFNLSPSDSKPEGTALGTGVVNGAGQQGNTIATNGWDAGQPLLFAAGDYIEINGELKMITEDVSSDAFGNATLNIYPIFRTIPPDGAQVISDNPSVVMMLTSNDQTQWAISSPVIYAITIDCKEALDI